MPAMTSLDQAVQGVYERHAALQPRDLTERLDHFEYVFPTSAAAKMVPLTPERGLYTFTERGESQLLQRLGIPAQLFKKLPPNIRWAIANHLAQSVSQGQQVTLRTIAGGKVRAVLSEGYAPMDDVDLVPMIADIVADLDARVQIASFNEDHSHLRIVFANALTEARPGDVLQTGLHVSNSEVGLRAVRVEPMVFRLVCSNGLVRQERGGPTTRIRHYGNPGRLKDQLAQAIIAARQDAKGLVAGFKRAVEHRLSNGQALLEAHGKSHDFTREQLKAAVEAFAVGNDPTLYGAVNAITAAAQHERSFERRYELERSAAGLLRHAS